MPPNPEGGQDGKRWWERWEVRAARAMMGDGGKWWEQWEWWEGVGGRGSGGRAWERWEIAPEPPKGDKLQVEGQVIGKR